MTKTILLATTAMLLTAGAAQAQSANGAPSTAPATPPQVAEAPVPTGPTQNSPEVDTAQQGVLVFTPDFFAEQRPNTALDMVVRVPGFSVNDGSGNRGFEGAVGNVLINNARPASKNDTGSNVLSRTPANQVERIELIRGGAPGIDMQGYSVVANVILKTENTRQSIVTFNANLFEGGQDLFGGSYQFTAREGERTWGVTLSDGISSSDSNGVGTVVRTDANGNVIRQEDWFNDQYGGGTAIRGNFATPLFGGKIDLTARYGVNDFHSVSLQTATDVRRENLYDDDGDSGEFGAVYTRPLSPRLNLETRLIHEWSTFDNASTSRTRLGAIDNPEQRFASEGDASESILRGLVRFEHSPALTFETGAEVAYNMLETNQAFTVGGVPVPLPSASVKVEEIRGEMFGKGTWRIDPKLTLEGGLRVEASTISQSGDADQEESFFFPKPRFLATWTPMADNQLRVRFEREVGQLDFGDFAASADLDDENVLGGNVDLVPEQRWISEAIYERRFWGEGIISIGLRHDAIVDAIDVIPLDDGLSAVGNIGDGTLDQLNVNFTLPFDKLGVPGGTFRFRNTWNKTEVTDPTTGEKRPISNVRPTQAVISWEHDITTWKFQYGGAWLPLLGQKSFDPDQSSSWRGSDYFELWAEYKPTATLSIRTQVNIWNDFDQERIVYADRTTRDILFIEERFIDPRTFWQIRLRKTF
ncbi:TonB-dependent receptor plug domain-containing protein [Brevundimonas sp. Root1279]|uniref:TonB-dependent receptor plug domain-containing protein n=1 Tax=Brevundimonas sp. Root1279 TaxID=1736443 RepID=UPI0006FE9FB9|nr:TonB-dependent receptor plug domain-containing protein [Brevundimonas sp. Root1279]KQW82580.1 TonB-dependent receptor [Brevundimonas sp. Root1279]